MLSMDEESLSSDSFGVSGVQLVDRIESHMVPEGAFVVFDWDNTLKVINKKERQIQSRVSPEFLSHLIEDKGCELFIISAIRPSRMNMDTLLLEVDRLGLRKFFAVSRSSRMSPQANFPWIREGNIIICGYDKAEAFLSAISGPTGFDEVDGISSDAQRPIVFFDDEDVNIENFSAIVKGSRCFKVYNS